ncbi:hypothetical protein [Vibrio parahaemolyticus]|uniref:hypothetical protein n=1 Tax=Vibrio parahaemolyticus TaxID=670 RepID=UPI003D816A56
MRLNQATKLFGVGAITFLAGFGFSQMLINAKEVMTTEQQQAVQAQVTREKISFTELAADLTKNEVIPAVPADHHPLPSVLDTDALIVLDSGKKPAEIFGKSWINMAAYSELFGNPVVVSHEKLSRILPDESPERLHELALELEKMEPGHAISLLIALSRNYQSGDSEKTAFYDAVTGVADSLGSMAFAMEITVSGHCDVTLSSKDLLRLVSNRRLSKDFARIYQKRRAIDIEKWIENSRVCKRVG